MKSSVKQTKIPFTERKLRTKTKCTTPKKIHSSKDENSPLKYKLVVSSESKIILRRSSSCRTKKSLLETEDCSTSNAELSNNSSEREGIFPENLQKEDCPTPTKRKCVEATPEANIATPSTLISRLHLRSNNKSNLTERVTPENNIIKTKGFTPKELFPSNNASSARKALYSSSNSLPCREDEIQRLSSLLQKHLEEQSCGSIYIAGLPGTGKTASIEHVIQTKDISKGYHIVKINCTSITSSVAIYKRICSELKINTSGKTEKDPKVIIEKYLLRSHKMILLILDEIDQLETRTQSVLYQIFEWPSWEKAKLVLIGIANAMDLTDRILPRLCAKVELKPVLIHFTPYSKDEIVKILSHRLSEVGADNIFTPGAIELISAKVAGMSGDVRRALDLGRRVVEISEESKGVKDDIEKTLNKRTGHNGVNRCLLTDFLAKNDCAQSQGKSEDVSDYEIDRVSSKKLGAYLPPNSKTQKSKRKLFEDKNCKVPNETTDNRENEGSPFKSPRKYLLRSPLKPDIIRRESLLKPVQDDCNFSVDSKDVLNVVKKIYESSKSLKNTEDSSFPLHQKILICTFLLISKKGKTKDLNVGKLHQVYTKICTKRGITPVDLSGFLFLCRQVEMTGIMQIGKGPGKLAKISLQWDETEVTDALKDLSLLSSILDDVSCL